MSCPTCDHTMQALCGHYFWCPRCGTIKRKGDVIDVEAPKLVERCRTLETEFIFGDEYPPLTNRWPSLGIAEAICQPSERKAS